MTIEEQARALLQVLTSRNTGPELPPITAYLARAHAEGLEAIRADYVKACAVSEALGLDSLYFPPDAAQRFHALMAEGPRSLIPAAPEVPSEGKRIPPRTECDCDPYMGSAQACTDKYFAPGNPPCRCPCHPAPAPAAGRGGEGE